MMLWPRIWISPGVSVAVTTLPASSTRRNSTPQIGLPIEPTFFSPLGLNDATGEVSDRP
ncbi:hypothetical protein D3C83_116480 [compost metagenome]